MNNSTENRNLTAGATQVGYTDGFRAVWEKDGALFQVWYDARNQAFVVPVSRSEITTPFAR